MKEHISEANGTAVKMAVTATSLGKEEFIVPPMAMQNEWMSIVEQSDKSKFEIKQALDYISAAQKALMRQQMEKN